MFEQMPFREKYPVFRKLAEIGDLRKLPVRNRNYTMKISRICVISTPQECLIYTRRKKRRLFASYVWA